MSNTVEEFRELIKERQEDQSLDIQMAKQSRPTTPIPGILPTQTTKAHETIAITELLVMILLHLPFESLLHSQQVCRYFKAVIEESRELRRALFLEPPRESCLEQPKLHPFLSRVLCPGTMCDAPPASLYQTGSLIDHPWYRSKDLRRAITYEKASWRRMFPSNIPCSVREATIAPSRTEETSWLAARADIREGFEAVTLECLWDIVVAYLAYWRSDKFEVTWALADGPNMRSWKVSIGEPEDIPSPTASINGEPYMDLSKRTLQEFLDEDPCRCVDLVKSEVNEWPTLVEW
ncbi:F-box protein [Aspergillus ibericus CBS 121593]|uniref:F-box domain-containing protein n=1 Tax=Aspergillus ibericus CBS 121593 TaxID=1448316 RepID=A0A395GMD7_9EURO|nr:hypothetical protein BO80DRAFT_438552 [Aspergillus ibericus CBS 121593]RAK96512.1 hypothetical protein BO80DRAFT_438552 [Aspergillus ibericus CBS 121593]